MYPSAPAWRAGRPRKCSAPDSTVPPTGGNPLVCAAALAVIDTIEGQNLCANAAAMGELISSTIMGDAAAAANIAEHRGRGLMLGFQLQADCGELVTQALDRGLLINVTAGNTVRLLPPLIIEQDQALDLARGVAELIGNFS